MKFKVGILVSLPQTVEVLLLIPLLWETNNKATGTERESTNQLGNESLNRSRPVGADLFIGTCAIMYGDNSGYDVLKRLWPGGRE